MTHPTPHEPDRTPPTGVDRSINQDDDSSHAQDDQPTAHSRDTLSGSDAWHKPGLVDGRGTPHA